LEVEIHGHAAPPGTFITLAPRQPLTPTPYALQTRGIVVADSGNIGIGTKTPTSKVEIVAQDGLTITGPQPFLTLRDTSGGGAVTIGNAAGLVGIGTAAPVGGLHIRHEPGALGGTLALEGVTHSYMSFFPRGADEGRKGWFGYGGALTNHMTVENDAGGDINLVTTGYVRINAMLEIGREKVITDVINDNPTTAYCPASKYIITGGCWCGTGNLLTSRPTFTDNGWECYCSGEPVQATAVCARVR
jgi:hypothetical protein